MKETIAIVVRHGYLVLFVWVLLEQFGLPLPSLPMLLAAGALAGAGQLSLQTALLLAGVAALISDLFWYAFGRWRGKTVLRWICKISIEPDSCVRRTENVYARYGEKSLLAAKFVPGFGTVATPLAGISRMPIHRFVFFDGLGIMIWTACYIGLGYAFADQLENIARYSLHFGEFLIIVIAAALLAYIAYKYIQRRRLLRELNFARISPNELMRMMNAGEQVQIVDLRHLLDFELDPFTVPGAIHVDPNSVDSIVRDMASDADVILYCN
jgi:membrane protein DedA with SNARE-associated domain